MKVAGIKSGVVMFYAIVSKDFVEQWASSLDLDSWLEINEKIGEEIESIRMLEVGDAITFKSGAHSGMGLKEKNRESVDKITKGTRPDLSQVKAG